MYYICILIKVNDYYKKKKSFIEIIYLLSIWIVHHHQGTYKANIIFVFYNTH